MAINNPDKMNRVVSKACRCREVGEGGGQGERFLPPSPPPPPPPPPTFHVWGKCPSIFTQLTPILLNKNTVSDSYIPYYNNYIYACCWQLNCRTPQILVFPKYREATITESVDSISSYRDGPDTPIYNYAIHYKKPKSSN